jgi:hypothetical protein
LQQLEQWLLDQLLSAADIGAWILPGVPCLIFIKLMHKHGIFAKIQQTSAYKAAATAAQLIGQKLLVDARDQALMVVSLGCAISSTGLTLLLVAQHLLHPGQMHWPIVLIRQAVMTGTLVLMFTAKHQESHRRKSTYKHPVAQALLQVGRTAMRRSPRYGYCTFHVRALLSDSCCSAPLQPSHTIHKCC